MDDNYQQLNLQEFLDLLAGETEKYTKAFASGNSTETDNCRTKVAALIEEINRRKGSSPSRIRIENSLESQSDAVSFT